MRLRRLGQPHNQPRRQSLFIAQPEPTAPPILRARAIIEICLPAVADKEQISEHRHARALLPSPSKRRNRNPAKLAQQIKQRRLNRRHRMDRHALIKGLLAAPRGIPIAEALADRIAESRCMQPISLPTTSGDVSSSTLRIFSPPGTSPTPLFPASSVSRTRLRVK